MQPQTPGTVKSSMPRHVALSLCLLGSMACGDDRGSDDRSTVDATTSAESTGSSTTADTADASGSVGSDDGLATTSTSGSTETTADTSDTTGSGTGPDELYRGPVLGGVVPGWDPDDPRPLVMMARQGDAWAATLARIGDGGELSDNVAEEIVVWGWDVAPPLLYDGPVVGGSIPGWTADAPFPVIMLGHRETDMGWWTTLASIGPGGELSDNLADRIIVWGWSSPTPSTPQLRYEGPLDANAMLDSWNPEDPMPLVMLGRFTGTDTWQSTLARILPDGTLTENLADELIVWGW